MHRYVAHPRFSAGSRTDYTLLKALGLTASDGPDFQCLGNKVVQPIDSLAQSNQCLHENIQFQTWAPSKRLVFISKNVFVKVPMHFLFDNFSRSAHAQKDEVPNFWRRDWICRAWRSLPGVFVFAVGVGGAYYLP